jgi:hypothetical protein
MADHDGDAKLPAAYIERCWARVQLGQELEQGQGIATSHCG